MEAVRLISLQGKRRLVFSSSLWNRRWRLHQDGELLGFWFICFLFVAMFIQVRDTQVRFNANTGTPSAGKHICAPKEVTWQLHTSMGLLGFDNEL